MNEPPIQAHVAPAKPPLDVSAIRGPAPQLMTYYLIVAILTLPGVFFALPALWFRYRTLQYRFDDEGISMRWGLFFRREVILTYRKIQDIHVSRGIIQRWLGLATVGVQTASGSATPEMSIEGILEAEELRDFLYAKMRGARQSSSNDAETATDESNKEVTALLTGIRDNLAKMADARGVK
jgi:uncharacterized protein